MSLRETRSGRKKLSDIALRLKAFDKYTPRYFVGFMYGVPRDSECFLRMAQERLDLEYLIHDILDATSDDEHRVRRDVLTMQVAYEDVTYILSEKVKPHSYARLDKAASRFQASLSRVYIWLETGERLIPEVR